MEDHGPWETTDEDHHTKRGTIRLRWFVRHLDTPRRSEKYDADLLQSLLVPYDATQMRAYPVSAMVGSPKNDVPDCIKEIIESA